MRRTETFKVGKILSIAAVFMLPLLLVAIAFAEGDQDFTLHNATGVEIHEVYISAHDVNDWEEDVLGTGTLADGEETEITFDPDEEAEHWDIKIVDGEGDNIVWESLKLTEITDITLNFKDGKAWAETENSD
jgi:hypothetical protein